MTFPEFSTRSCSFFASANATAARNEKPIRATQILFIGSLHSLRPYGEYTPNSGRDRQTPRGDADSNRRPIIKQVMVVLVPTRGANNQVDAVVDLGCGRLSSPTLKPLEKAMASGLWLLSVQRQTSKRWQISEMNH